MNPFNLSISIFLLITTFISSCSNSKLNENEVEYYSVIRVVDGDTFKVDDGSKQGMTIRLIGVDTPETVHPQKAVEYYGKEASDFMKELIVGKTVRLEYDVEPLDRYKRTLAYVYLEDGTFVNEYLVKNGYAKVMTVPPNVKYADAFIKLERQARRKNKGLWNEPVIDGD